VAIHPALRRAIKLVSRLRGDMQTSYKTYRTLDQINGKFTFTKRHYKKADFQVRHFDHLIPLRLYQAPHASPDDLVIFFHGGGWVTGNIDSYDRTCQNISDQTSQTVLAVDYCLAPEHPFPAALLECYAVTQRVLSGNAGVAPERVTLMGDSAGGNLAAAVSLLAKEAGEPIPGRQILIYPSVASRRDGYPSYHRFGKDYLLTKKRVEDYLALYASKPEDLDDCYLAPILANDLTNQPETLIITADHDVLRDEGEAYGRRLLDAGNEVIVYRLDDALHGMFTLPPSVPQVAKCYELINDFLQRRGNQH